MGLSPSVSPSPLHPVLGLSSIPQLHLFPGSSGTPMVQGGEEGRRCPEETQYFRGGRAPVGVHLQTSLEGSRALRHHGPKAHHKGVLSREAGLFAYSFLLACALWRD